MASKPSQLQHCYLKIPKASCDPCALLKVPYGVVLHETEFRIKSLQKLNSLEAEQDRVKCFRLF